MSFFQGIVVGKTRGASRVARSRVGVGGTREAVGLLGVGDEPTRTRDALVGVLAEGGNFDGLVPGVRKGKYKKIKEVQKISRKFGFKIKAVKAYKKLTPKKKHRRKFTRYPKNLKIKIKKYKSLAAK
jgi:hypothetical protein